MSQTCHGRSIDDGGGATSSEGAVADPAVLEVGLR